jgi:hypothetical protein
MTIGSALLLALAAISPPMAGVIDFQAQTVATSDLTGIPNSPLTIGIATFTRDQLLNSEVSLPADQTGVYVTEGLFGSGETNPLVINLVRFMHDNASVTSSDAIQRHQGEVQGVVAKLGVTNTLQRQLITFLNSL